MPTSIPSSPIPIASSTAGGWRRSPDLASSSSGCSSWRPRPRPIHEYGSYLHAQHGARPAPRSYRPADCRYRAIGHVAANRAWCTARDRIVGASAGVVWAIAPWVGILGVTFFGATAVVALGAWRAAVIPGRLTGRPRGRAQRPDGALRSNGGAAVVGDARGRRQRVHAVRGRDAGLAARCPLPQARRPSASFSGALLPAV